MGCLNYLAEIGYRQAIRLSRPTVWLALVVRCCQHIGTFVVRPFHLTLIAFLLYEFSSGVARTVFAGYNNLDRWLHSSGNHSGVDVGNWKVNTRILSISINGRRAPAEIQRLSTPIQITLRHTEVIGKQEYCDCCWCSPACWKQFAMLPFDAKGFSSHLCHKPFPAHLNLHLPLLHPDPSHLSWQVAIGHQTNITT